MCLSMCTFFRLLFFVSIVILCPVLTNPNNGDVMVGLRTLNSIATYNCSMGFVLVGDQRRTCLMSGEWSGTEPQCRSE